MYPFAVFEWYPSIYHIAGFLFFSALENLASAYTKTDGDLVWFCSKKCIESVGLQVHTLTLIYAGYFYNNLTRGGGAIILPLKSTQKSGFRDKLW